MRRGVRDVIIAAMAASVGAIVAATALPLEGQAPPGGPVPPAPAPAYRAPRLAGKSGFERHLAGAERSQLRPRGAHGAPGDGAAARARTVRCRRRRCSRSARSARSRRASAWSRATRSRTSPRRCAEEEENQEQLARARSRDQVLPAGRAARDLHAATRSRSSRAPRRCSSPTSTRARCATST